jgi:hypothetical protein
MAVIDSFAGGVWRHANAKFLRLDLCGAPDFHDLSSVFLASV